ncbi:hypothetical protein QTP70_018537 [Hemibagrus guttatus]|uniref:Ig-like domain-containing protein n=1 Tax=Hemibagrus guttatus TaxID=175788 RepID=A0AAE0PQN9_9TELE|nr:hypothetical protein QTP70_018537 [Hemibagrus guttatus]
MFLWGASPHDVASVGALPHLLPAEESFGSTLLPPARPLGSSRPQRDGHRRPGAVVRRWDIARCECSAVDVARSCCSAVDVAWSCCSAVDVIRLCGSAVDVIRLYGSAVDLVRRLRSAVDVASDPLALPSGPLLPPLVSLLLLTPPTCLALILVPPTCLALILVPPTCLALVLASPHSPCFCFSLPPQVPRPAPRSPHRPLYVPSSSPGPIAGPDFLGGARLRPFTMFTVIFMCLWLSLGDSMADSIETLFTHKVVDEGDSMADSIEPLFTHKVVDEGDNVTLSCKYKTSRTSDDLHWYRQYPKSKPEFLLYVIQSGTAISNTDPRISAKADDKQVDLIISSAAVSDSALYYCALQPTVTGNPAALYKNFHTVLLY